MQIDWKRIGRFVLGSWAWDYLFDADPSDKNDPTDRPNQIEKFIALVLKLVKWLVVGAMSVILLQLLGMIPPKKKKR